MANTATATSGAKKKRGDGPVKITFSSASKAEPTKRVPLDVTAINVWSRATGQTKSYKVSEIASSITTALCSGFAAKRMDQQARNLTNGMDVHAITDKVWAMFQAGAIFAKKEGAGREFDFAKWKEAIELAASKKKNNPQAARMGAALVKKIESLSGKARTQFLNKLKADKGIAVALREIELRNEKGKDKGEFDAFSMEL